MTDHPPPALLPPPAKSAAMSEQKSPVPGASWFQIGGVLVVVAIAWGSLDSRTQANKDTATDHEARLRVIEREVTSSLARIEQQLIEIKRTQQP